MSIISESIHTPDNDDRSYRLIALENGLHALLISDPTADKSGAALDVNVGSITDKKYNVSGLAHFCEHLLFMGTKEFPGENEYSEYLSKNSGNSNAYTSLEHTNYYFQVNSLYLKGALDRFSKFFINPLFSPSCKDREINAVDSENKKNLQNDLWRLYQIDKATSEPTHPFNGFSTGNYTTLHTIPVDEGRDVREVLIDFHSKEYSANIMSLVILGKELIDELTTWATDYFSPIKNNNISGPVNDGKVLTKDQLSTLVKVKTVMDKNNLELKFFINDDLEAKNPSVYYTHLLGHETKGLILDYCKSKNWVLDLSVGCSKIVKGNAFLELDFVLTEKGLAHWEDIVKAVFQYIKFISDHGPQAYIFNELKSMKELDFKFKQKGEVSSTVSRLSSKLYKVKDGFINGEDILKSPGYEKFDSKAITEFGKYLNVNNFKIVLSSKSFDNLPSKEKWYGTEYSVEKLSKEFLDSLSLVKSITQLHFPTPNMFIPKNLGFNKKKNTPLLHPYLITDTDKLRLWFKQDDTFEVPKGTIYLHLGFDANENIKKSVSAELLALLFNDSLTSITYFASLVGISISFMLFRDGFVLKVSGYNDKLPTLLEILLQSFFSYSPDSSKFSMLKFKLEQELKNFGYGVPYNQIGTRVLTLVNEKTYEHLDRLKALQSVNFDDVKEYVKTLFTSINAEGLVHGNFDISSAKEIKNIILRHIDSIKTKKREPLRNYILNENARYETELDDANNINSCIETFIQTSPAANERLLVLTDLVSTIMKEPCFNQLRTKEQLGYVVFSGTRKFRNSFGIRILIQSERDTAYLEYRTAEFLQTFGRYVDKLSDDDFIKAKQTLKEIKTTKLKHLSEEGGRFWSSISDGYYNFKFRNKHVKILEGIEKQEFKDFFKKVLGSKKVVAHLKSKKVPEVTKEKIIKSSIVNFNSRHDLNIDLDSVDVNDYSGLIEDKELQFKLEEAVKTDLESPIPKGYPSGKLYSISEFQSHFELGESPKPVQNLADFYYPEESHL